MWNLNVLVLMSQGGDGYRYSTMLCTRDQKEKDISCSCLVQSQVLVTDLKSGCEDCRWALKAKYISGDPYWVILFIKFRKLIKKLVLAFSSLPSNNTGGFGFSFIYLFYFVIFFYLRYDKFFFIIVTSVWNWRTHSRPKSQYTIIFSIIRDDIWSPKICCTVYSNVLQPQDISYLYDMKTMNYIIEMLEYFETLSASSEYHVMWEY